MNVRRLEPPDDVARAGGLLRQAYTELEGYPDDPEYDDIVADVAARAGQADVVVAVDDIGTIVGCLTFVPHRDCPDAEFDDVDAVGFRYFGVDPAMQGRGVGEAMVSWVLDEARRLGRRRVRIHTLDAMRGAQRLYRRMGFVRDPTEDQTFDGIVLLAFVLHL